MKEFYLVILDWPREDPEYRLFDDKEAAIRHAEEAWGVSVRAVKLRKG